MPRRLATSNDAALTFPNPWASRSPQREEAKASSASIAHAKPSLWQQFLVCVEQAALPDHPGTLTGQQDQPHAESVLREIRTDGGLISLALDPDTKFLSLRRLVAPAGLPGGSGALLDAEAFWVPISPEESRCGIRVRQIGSCDAIASHFSDAWLLFALEHDLAMRKASWEGVPSHQQLTATWAASGNVVIDIGDAESLQTQLAAATSELQVHEQLASEQEQTLRTLRQELSHWKLAAKNAQAAWQSGMAGEASAEVADTTLEWDSFEPLAAWAQAHADTITVLPRAINAAKKADYTRPDHIRQALEVLAGPYRESRLGLIAREEFETALDLAGVKLAGSVGISVAGEEGDAYYVSYGGRRQLLDLHLKRGGGRQTRYCMRVYFFWDDDAEKAVVGWLPSHLANSLT